MGDADIEFSREERKNELCFDDIIGMLIKLGFVLTLDFPFNEIIFVLIV